jgi:hypothetical protein
MQSLYPDQFDTLMEQVRQIAAVLGRDVQSSATDQAKVQERTTIAVE